MAAAATFLGRERECQDLAVLLEAEPMVTLVGPGGIGKTRLATELSSDLADRFDGGVLVSELSGFDDGDDIPSVVARHLGCDSLASLRYRSVGKRTLVVLDNCESALGQAGDVARELVADDSTITVLATSRAPLQVQGEHIVAVEPLGVPNGADVDIRDVPAVRLFIDRAERSGANWPLTETNLEAIGRLVQRLDGLPLAIELAAGRSRVLSPPDLVTHLDSQLDLLARPGDGADRHQSLRTAIRTSYDPLPQRPQRLFRHLAVMPAPFDLDLAHAVGGAEGTPFDTLDQLGELVNASLIEVRQGDDDVTRYRMFDSIRAFGLEQLDLAGETVDLNDRYVDAMVAFADAVVADALDSFGPVVMGRIRNQFVHLANAIGWCIDHDETGARAYRLFVPLYGPTGARSEIAALAQRVLAAWDEPAPMQAEAMAVMGISTLLSGDAAVGGDLARGALSHPDATSIARMVSNRTLGMIAAQDGDIEAAERHLEDAIDIAIGFSASFARELQISWSAAVSDPARSAEVLKRLQAVGRQAAAQDEVLNVFWSGVVSAYHHAVLGDQAAALRSAAAAMASAYHTGFQWSIGSGHRMMGQVLALQGGWDAAAPHYRSAVDHTLSVGDIEGTAVTLRSAAGAARHVGDQALAGDLWGCVPDLRGRPLIRSLFHDEEAALLEELGAPAPASIHALVTRARALLGPPDGNADGSDDAAVAPDPGPAPPPAGSVVRFDGFELDVALCELRSGVERVHVEPQVFDVLAYLVENRGAVVTKVDLLDNVWGDRFVSESALTSRIKAARRAIGDDGTAQRSIRTVHGKGYTFIAEVDPS